MMHVRRVPRELGRHKKRQPFNSGATPIIQSLGHNPREEHQQQEGYSNLVCGVVALERRNNLLDVNDAYNETRGADTAVNVSVFS